MLLSPSSSIILHTPRNWWLRASLFHTSPGISSLPDALLLRVCWCWYWVLYNVSNLGLLFAVTGWPNCVEKRSFHFTSVSYLPFKTTRSWRFPSRYSRLFLTDAKRQSFQSRRIPSSRYSACSLSYCFFIVLCLQQAHLGELGEHFGGGAAIHLTRENFAEYPQLSLLEGQLS